MERRLAAILVADVVGYTHLMGQDEAGTLTRLTSLREVSLKPLIAEHRGRIVKLMGDGILVEFASVVDAVNCAVAWQNNTAEEDLRFRIGVNLGDIIIEDGDIYGDGVNVAARLEGLAEPGGICISGKVYEEVRNKLPTAFEDLGQREVKNIPEPVRVYRWADAATDPMPDMAEVQEAPPLPDKPSIAVLPFTNMSGGREQEYLSDGISEDIITALSKISKLFVVARNSTFTYKGQAVDVKQVGREQGVQYVLEGSVRREGDRLRISAQLIDAAAGHHIWAQRYDRAVQDVFELQDEITREVTSALQVELTEGEQARLWASGTKNFEAWEIVIQVPELLFGHRREKLLKARRLAERALQLDENYATAWTWLGWSHWEEAFGGWSKAPDASLALAMDALAHAQSIDETNPDTLALIALVHLSLRKHDKASDFAARAMTLGPNNSLTPFVAANVALFCNRPHDMIVLLKKAMRLCPAYPPQYVGDLAWAHLLLDHREETIAMAQEAIKIDPDYIYSYVVLAIAYVELGRAQDACAAAQIILRIEPNYSLRKFAETQPFRDADVLDRHVRGLRQAGLPE